MGGPLKGGCSFKGGWDPSAHYDALEKVHKTAVL